jgi:hypothetical protein
VKAQYRKTANTLVGVLLLTSFLIWGCKSRKVEVMTPQPVDTLEVEPYPYFLPDSLYQAIRLADAPLGYFAARAAVELEMNKETKSFQANIRIRSDSAIWMSISPALGIEVARALITRDSIKFINRLNGSYFKGDIHFLNQMMQVDVNFDMIESVLTGNAYLHYSVDKYISDRENGERILSTFKKRRLRRENELDIPQILSQEIWFSPVYQKITRMELTDYKPLRKLSVQYPNFEVIEGIKVPRTLVLQASADKQVKIQIDYSKQSVNKEQNLPFSIPEDYEPMR